METVSKAFYDRTIDNILRWHDRVVRHQNVVVNASFDDMSAVEAKQEVAVIANRILQALDTISDPHFFRGILTELALADSKIQTRLTQESDGTIVANEEFEDEELFIDAAGRIVDSFGVECSQNGVPFPPQPNATAEERAKYQASVDDALKRKRDIYNCNSAREQGQGVPPPPQWMLKRDGEGQQ
jgi:hypothetical protein